MRSRTLAVVFILAFAISTIPAPVVAAPGSDIWTEYFDCHLNPIGEKFRGCNSTSYNWGASIGHFMAQEVCPCNGTACTYTWYVWNGSGYTKLPGQPSPAC